MEHQAAMELGYFANSLDMGLAKNLPVEQPCHNGITSQQYYYEYNHSTAPAQASNYLFVPSLPISTSTQAIYSIDGASHQHFDLASSTSDNGLCGVHSPVYTTITTYPAQSIPDPYGGGFALESSVFLSPQTSAPSSAAHSPQPQTPEPQGELLDLPSLDDILFNEEDLLSDQIIANELFDVLTDVGCSDFLDQLEFGSQTGAFDTESCFTPSQSSSSSSSSNNSSVSSTPKRKYSSDSSDCYSLDSFETCSSDSKPKASSPKRARRCKPTKEEKAARKKDQNKKAASRYRNKRKSEMQCSEVTLDELESHRDGLTEQLKKLQTELSVILPLAKAAFALDPVRNQHLTQLIARVNALN